MKRGELVCAVLGLVMLALSTWFLAATGGPQREEVVTVSGCELRMTVLGRDDAPASALMFHGLTANRRTMLALARSLEAQIQVFVLDHPGHGDSSQAFSYERAEACAATTVEWLEKQGRIQMEETVLIGHSMGAGIAIRLADRFPTAATISISTGMHKPMVGNPLRMGSLPLPRRLPINLFLITAEYDPPQLKAVTQHMVEATGGERYGKDDFAQRRAVRWSNFSGATHTSLIFDHRVHVAICNWIERSLPLPASLVCFGALPGIVLFFFGLLALLLAFPLAASLICGGVDAKNTGPTTPAAGWKALIAWAVAALLAVLLQFTCTTLGPIVQMYSGDYLASVLMIVGVVLLAWQMRAQHGSAALTTGAVPRRWDARALLSAVVLGLAAMLAFGTWLNWQITDAWLNAPRWWRFVVLVPLVLPYFVAEEIALGAPPAGWLARLGRLAKFLTLRAILWLAMVFGLFVLQSAQVLLALLVIYLAAFSIAQRAGMDAVRRRAGSAAAAVFGAILAAWFIAAVFPIT